ncbi:hypothetical protein VTK56DRAFT_6205 [Thermocarpiscus australiensis]
MNHWDGHHSDGPFHRSIRRKTPKQIAEEILKCAIPTYYITKRAWNILEYCRRPKPTTDEFIPQANALWRHQAGLKTLRGRKARAYMLDALRTLGFRNPTWNVNTTELHMRPGDQDGGWNRLPGPGMGSRGYPDAREYLAAQAPLATDLERGHRFDIENMTWKEFHRYKGLPWWTRVARGSTSGRFLFPEAPTRCGSVSHYHMLQYKSKSVDEDFGTLSMARSLYASPSQGKPAYPHHYLLYVIADYFKTQVILFEGGPRLRSDHQSQALYTYTVYGHRNELWNTLPNPPPSQIFLITNADKTHYDPVVLDDTPLHATPFYSPAADRTTTNPPANNRNTTKFPFRTDRKERGMCPPTGPYTWRAGGPPWLGSWAHPPAPDGPPHRQARYNFLVASATRWASTSPTGASRGCCTWI